MRAQKQFHSFLALTFLIVSTASAQQKITVFKNVNVVTMQSSEVKRNQSVIVKDGFISLIDTVPKVKIPKEANIIDGTGKYLMPGLADMHAHLTHPEASYFAENNLATVNLLLAHGVTTIRNMWGSEELLRFVKNVNSGKTLGPRIYSTGPFIVGRPDTLTSPWNAEEVKLNPTELYARTEEDGRAIARYHAEIGYDFIKVHNNTTLKPYYGLTNEATVPIIGHAPRPIGLAKILTIGKQSSIEHYDAFIGLAEKSNSPAKSSPNWYDQYFGAYAYPDEERILLLAELIKSSKTYFTPTIIMAEWYNGSQPDMIKHLASNDVMRFTSQKQRDIWKEYAEGFALNYTTWKLDMKQQRIFALKLVNLFHKSGVPLLLGTDATPVMGIQGISTLEELLLMVEAGLSPYEALKTGTVNVHKYLKQAGKELGTGTIQMGEPADLLLLNSNPLLDISNIKLIEGVMTQGRWLNRQKLDDMIKEVEKIYLDN